MRTSEREKQITIKLRELDAGERERTSAVTELAKQEAALAQRERALERKLAELESDRGRVDGRVEARESVLGTARGEPARAGRRGQRTATARSPSASAS